MLFLRITAKIFISISLEFEAPIETANSHLNKPYKNALKYAVCFYLLRNNSDNFVEDEATQTSPKIYKKTQGKSYYRMKDSVSQLLFKTRQFGSFGVS